MLTEQQCQLIEYRLRQKPEPRKMGAFLCLHMGLSLAEICALSWADIELGAGRLHIGHMAVKEGESLALVPADMPRTLPMPPHVRRFLLDNQELYQSDDAYIMTGDGQLPAFHQMQNVLSAINRRKDIGDKLSAMDLRNAFIRRCIEAGMDLYTLCFFVGIKQPNVILKRFEAYFKARPETVFALEKYSQDTTKEAKDKKNTAGMNLLILGAGSQGPVVKEIAEALGIFSEIAFLDDDPNNKLAIGPLSDYQRLRDIFPCAVPSFGDSQLRREYYDKLLASGYAIPRLIHPSATISSSNVELGSGVVIEAKVIIANDVRVEDNVILSAGCVLDRECVIHADCHVGCACTVTRGSHVPEKLRIPAGTVYKDQER